MKCALKPSQLMPTAGGAGFRIRSVWLVIMLVLLPLFASPSAADDTNADRIRPDPNNPSYWQYKGQPIMLLGGNPWDAPFFIEEQEAAYDELLSAGGNLLRYILKQRHDDSGSAIKLVEIFPFKKLGNGKYDLNQWSDDYWNRFDSGLRMCEERNIIAQITLWDHFDFYRDQWEISPWNPRNNTNYTSSESGLATSYPVHPSEDTNPFLKTVPTMLDNTVVLDFQKKLIAKMMSIALRHDNVLYNMANEGNLGQEKWDQWWCEFISSEAAAAGKTIYTTTMFDKQDWGPVVNNPGTYTYVEGSKVGSRWTERGQAQYDVAVGLIKDAGAKRARPVNAVKIRTQKIQKHAQERLWRPLMAGFAALSHHRATPDGDRSAGGPGSFDDNHASNTYLNHGLGLGQDAKNNIKAMRAFTHVIVPWETTPRQDLLTGRASDEAYLRAKADEVYGLYFVDTGTVGLKLDDVSGTFRLRWIDIAKGGYIGTEQTLTAGRTVTITTPGNTNGGWAAVITRMRSTSAASTESGQPNQPALVRVVDLGIGESRVVELCDGTRARVRLREIDERRDTLKNALREARVQVEVNGEPVTLTAGTYHLPRSVAGVRIDCPVTKGYLSRLSGDARIRLWPAGSPLAAPGTFTYPLRQRWFASGTQMAYEPAFINGGEEPSSGIYYHSALDFGGAEGMVDVVSATDGLVVTAGGKRLAGHEEPRAYAGYDTVYTLDDRGWYAGYVHLQSIDPAIRLGERVKRGQKIGTLGKEGGSGGWSHLHFSLRAKDPSGTWGTLSAYPFVWEAYQRQYHPELLAVARPHHLANVNETVTLDASRSWSRSESIASYEWTLTGGDTASGQRVKRSYAKPGTYSEILKVVDERGRTSYDFAVVQVHDREHLDSLPPTIDAAYAPTLGIQPGDPVTFKVRTFRTEEGHEVWDFGDSSDRVTVQSQSGGSRNPDGYAVTTHRYEKPGDYIVRVERSNERGEKAVAHLHVQVEQMD